MNEKNYCIGVDYGTDSVRCIVVDAADGQELASSVFYYPRWKRGLYSDAGASRFRQHPLDYVEGLTEVITAALSKVEPGVRQRIRAISMDTTGSTPVPVDETGTPLALRREFSEDPDAMFILWKDHSSVKEVEEINQHAKLFEQDYLKYVGGFYSSEWFWSKLLYVLRNNPAVREACYSWVEHADWMPFLLTGGRHVSQMKRNVCTAGHKALWSEEWGGLPPEEFFSSLDPLLAGYRARMYDRTFTADQSAGTLSPEWAQKLGLSEEVIVTVGAIDAHMGAVGGQIEPYYISKVMGTSTCDMLVAPAEETAGKFVEGICGLVNGSIIPGMIGMEAGQSAFGDVYAWFKNLLLWPYKKIPGSTSLSEDELEAIAERIIPELSRLAAAIPVEEDHELAVDWFNGRRTPDANALLKGGIFGLDLATDPPKIFYSLVESTCFGARAIVERFQEQGIPVKGLIGIGGIARKSPFVMQMLADVIGMPIKVHKSDQTCAMGAAMFAATAAGIYTKVEDAMKAMGIGFEKEYVPDLTRNELYNRRYRKYFSAGRFIEGLSARKEAEQQGAAFTKV